MRSHSFCVSEIPESRFHLNILFTLIHFIFRSSNKVYVLCFQKNYQKNGYEWNLNEFRITITLMKYYQFIRMILSVQFCENKFDAQWIGRLYSMTQNGRNSTQVSVKLWDWCFRKVSESIDSFPLLLELQMSMMEKGRTRSDWMWRFSIGLIAIRNRCDILSRARVTW